MADPAKNTVVEVELNQQQEVIIKRLIQDGSYGTTESEVIRKALDDFLRQTFTW